MKLLNRVILATVILSFSVHSLIEYVPKFNFSFSGGFNVSLFLILLNISLLVYAIVQYFVVFGELLHRKLNGTPKIATEDNHEEPQQNDELTAFDKIDTTVEVSKDDLNFLVVSFAKFFAIIIGVGLMMYVITVGGDVLTRLLKEII